jgi:hypothetical protein
VIIIRKSKFVIINPLAKKKGKYAEDINDKI